MSPLVVSVAAFSLVACSASRSAVIPSNALAQTDPSLPRPAYYPHHAFVAVGKSGLRVYDIADVDAVREAGARDEGDEKAVSIAMAWPHVLMARSKRLELFDVRDPGHPTRLASVSVPGVVKALRLYRGRAWVLTEDAGLVGYRFR